MLDALEQAGFLPSLIVAAPDKIARDKTPVFPPEKAWALAHGIEVAQPARLDDTFRAKLRDARHDFYIVASYGKILPAELLAIPRRGVVNLHPSLLPRLRGPSPIRSAILEDEKEVGVSIMLLDDKMDHGPLIGQKKVTLPERPMRGRALDELLAREGATLLAEALPRWLSGEVEPRAQDHAQATYCKMFSKEDGLLDLAADPQQNLRTIRAFEGWPGTYAFFEKNGARIRVNILDAHIERGALVINRVIPEGKREMTYADFMR